MLSAEYYSSFEIYDGKDVRLHPDGPPYPLA
jgi:hypothetical protein